MGGFADQLPDFADGLAYIYLGVITRCYTCYVAVQRLECHNLLHVKCSGGLIGVTKRDEARFVTNHMRSTISSKLLISEVHIWHQIKALFCMTLR